MSDNVIVGDIWRDVDPRRSDRRFSIEAIVGEEAVCQSLDNPRQFTKIKLRRFIPKYYEKVISSCKTNPAPVITSEPSSSLLESCKNTIKGDWVHLNTDSVKLEEGPFSIIIRQLENNNRDGYETKIIINDVVTQNWVIYVDTLKSPITDYIKSILLQMKHSLDKMVC